MDGFRLKKLYITYITNKITKSGLIRTNGLLVSIGSVNPFFVSFAHGYVKFFKRASVPRIFFSIIAKEAIQCLVEVNSQRQNINVGLNVDIEVWAEQEVMLRVIH